MDRPGFAVTVSGFIPQRTAILCVKYGGPGSAYGKGHPKGELLYLENGDFFLLQLVANQQVQRLKAINKTIKR